VGDRRELRSPGKGCHVRAPGVQSPDGSSDGGVGRTGCGSDATPAGGRSGRRRFRSQQPQRCDRESRGRDGTWIPPMKVNCWKPWAGGRGALGNKRLDFDVLSTCTYGAPPVDHAACTTGRLVGIRLRRRMSTGVGATMVTRWSPPATSAAFPICPSEFVERGESGPLIAISVSCCGSTSRGSVGAGVRIDLGDRDQR
jgi:hypothetical protein